MPSHKRKALGDLNPARSAVQADITAAESAISSGRCTTASRKLFDAAEGVGAMLARPKAGSEGHTVDEKVLDSYRDALYRFDEGCTVIRRPKTRHIKIERSRRVRRGLNGVK